MNTFNELLSVMRLYESNFRNLHWNSRGEEFNDAHKSITEEYYELYAKNIDRVAEMNSMLGFLPPNYIETAEIINNSEVNYVVIDSAVLYDRKAIVTVADNMFADTCALLAAVLQEECFNDHINDGIKSEFESVLYDFTLQWKYINGRKLV